MKNKKILKEIINTVREEDWYFLDENIICNYFWCYEYKKEVIRLGDLKENGRTFLLETKKQKKMRDEIKENGLNYKKGYIILSNDSDIVDGNHRVKYLSDNFHPDSLVKVVRLKNLNSEEQTKELYFYFLFISPIKIVYTILKCLKNVFK